MFGLLYYGRSLWIVLRSVVQRAVLVGCFCLSSQRHFRQSICFERIVRDILPDTHPRNRHWLGSKRRPDRRDPQPDNWRLDPADERRAFCRSGDAGRSSGDVRGRRFHVPEYLSAKVMG